MYLSSSTVKELACYDVELRIFCRKRLYRISKDAYKP